MTASRKKATPAASSIVLSSRRLRLITVRNSRRSTSAPSTASVTAEAASATNEGQAQLPIDFIGDEAAEHVHLPVREIQHVHQREDQRQPERDQRVLGAEIEPVGDDLFHGDALPAAGATAAAAPSRRMEAGLLD